MTSHSYLIAGGCSVVGVNLASTILAQDPLSEVTMLECPLAHPYAASIAESVRVSPRFHHVIGEIANEKLLISIIQQRKIDVVFSTAKLSNSNGSANPVEEARYNLIGITHFLEALRASPKLHSFVYVSSEKVYGSSLPKVETAMLKPVTSEAASQCASEAMLNAYFVSYGLPLIIARVSSLICGPNMDSNNVIRTIIEGLETDILDESPQSLIDLRDVVSGLLACAHKGSPGQIYNIGGERDVSVAELRKLFDKIRSGEVISECDLPRASMNCTKAYRELAWRPQVPLLKALKNSFDHYVSHPTVGLSQNIALKFLVYGARGWIGQQFVALLEERKIEYAIGERRIGTDADEAVQDEIVAVAPSHVVCMIGRTHGSGVNSIAYLEGGPERLYENMRDNLYAPCVLANICDRLKIHFTYLGTGCIFHYDEMHPYGGKGYTEKDYGNYWGTSYSAVKAHTDWLMRYYSNTLNARIRLPINYELDSRNLVIGFSRVFDIPNSVTVLPDCLPILLDLAIKRHCGTINLVNPGPIRFPEIIDLYKKLVDPSVQCEIVKPESDDEVLRSRAHCTLDTSKLQRLYPSMRTAIEGIKQSVIEIAVHKGKRILQQA
ncbi:unnamed protein product [Toxocara canis]|uniref:Epimerase domain-containing protein n=1 Tax=Toxocara canis TaxID=6265 RepID=A0A183TVP7_TOXCA|nr:unnamed protein product [Toxocara canis]